MTLRADLEKDLADIHGAAEISTVAVVAPVAGGAAWNLPGILRSPYRPERLGGQEIGGQGFRYLCRTIDKTGGNLKRDDRLTIDGSSYRLTEAQDGNPTAGMSTLILAPL